MRVMAVAIAYPAMDSFFSISYVVHSLILYMAFRGRKYRKVLLLFIIILMGGAET